CQSGGDEGSSVFSVVRNNDANRLGQYLAEGGNPNARNEDGDSLLYVASGAKGGPEVVEVLLIGGADPDIISREGRTPLHTAAGWCNEQTLELLIAAGARLDIKNSEGKLAKDVVCAQPRERRERVLAILVAAQAS
ncbi:MAG: ankyrin repeat domain-containing protein, partial [Devosiaceae bacterium]|nr:ankyrin repeat domain-containing protein [Devosiaceae bacterium]